MQILKQRTSVRSGVIALVSWIHVSLRVSTICAILFSFVLLIDDLSAQVIAGSNAFNDFEREAVAETDDGAGYSFYSAVWPFHQRYPGAERFQVGLPHTWMRPFIYEGESEDNYNTIEGGLGWWHDTRFGTEFPKFIMGGVAYNFSQWANGVGLAAPISETTASEIGIHPAANMVLPSFPRVCCGLLMD